MPSSTGPGSPDPATGKPHGSRFPEVTIGDIVRSQLPLLDHLGVERLLAATGGDLKYKISGVYFELLLEMLAALPARSEGRRLYNGIFDAVLKLLKAEVRKGGALAQPLLVAQLSKYDRQTARNPKRRRDPRAE